jgi:hypothetical protein
LGGLAQFSFDPQKLVVLGHAVGTSGSAGFDLSGVQGHCQIGDGGIFGFAGAVRGDCTPASAVAGFNGFNGLGERADLV